ncbi:MarR family winged helix-turn-helix transcriptional regulator [Sanguibacter suaedae]|uniref:MarR family winged helix-turn-helix transcriptional regulator n=1 Tax=Sanguibacter suaedae TaxID=2795737 RepID=UPI0027DC9151|nr:MarR family winged helix-turn-helix transcriptional regulator [Sanguibacter suaedae]
MAEDPSTWPTGRLLSHVARRLEREWNAHLEQWHLNHASLPVLLALLRSDHSQRELAAASDVTEQTMSRTVARLERTGYVTRVTSPSDARRHVVRLTDAGRTTVTHAAQVGPGEDIVARGLRPDQVTALREILVTMVASGDTDDED